jgi:hypothetical protein
MDAKSRYAELAAQYDELSQAISEIALMAGVLELDHATLVPELEAMLVAAHLRKDVILAEMETLVDVVYAPLVERFVAEFGHLLGMAA